MSYESPSICYNPLSNKDNFQSVFQTPFKSTSNINEHKSYLADIISSGSLNRSINYSANKCILPDCLMCVQMDSILKNLVMSPSTNFLYNSPSSLEKLVDSVSRERINVMKLVKKKQEHLHLSARREIKKENKENSKTSSASKSVDNDSEISQSTAKNLERIVESIFTEKRLAKKNLMKIFNKNENNNNSNINTNDYYNEVVNQNNFNDIDNCNLLQKKVERPKIEEEEAEYKFIRKESNNSNTFKDILLNSPVRVRKDSKYSYFSEGKSLSITKKKIFECSAQKYLNNSCAKSAYAPTIDSTEKKEKKRLRKSSEQLKALKDIYDFNNNKDWNKEMITDISGRIGLPENKVYKWLWDKKNKEIMDKKVFYIQSG